MPSHDPSAAATKQDIGILMEEFATIRTEIMDAEERTKRHFDLTVETIRHDLLGANRDDIETIKDRIARLERHAGFATR